MAEINDFDRSSNITDQSGDEEGVARSRELLALVKVCAQIDQ
jgi:hypothetical protein